MNRSVEDVLFDIVDLCDSQRLDYAVMGGIAVRVHGIPRPTFDVDIELTVTPAQLELFFEGAEERNYTIAEPYRSGWRDVVGGMPLVKLRTYLTPGNGIDIDVFLNETPFQRSVMKRRIPYAMKDRILNFVTPEDLILLKLLANRPRDWGDVADVIFVQGQLDQCYMHEWATSLGITDRLTTALDKN